MGVVINVWTEINKYKKAICKCCLNKLVENETIVGVVRAQGRFNSISNYHPKCAEQILTDIMEETTVLMKQLVDVSEKITAYEQAKCENNSPQA